MGESGPRGPPGSQVRWCLSPYCLYVVILSVVLVNTFQTVGDIGTISISENPWIGSVNYRERGRGAVLYFTWSGILLSKRFGPLQRVIVRTRYSRACVLKEDCRRSSGGLLQYNNLTAIYLNCTESGTSTFAPHGFVKTHATHPSSQNKPTVTANISGESLLGMALCNKYCHLRIVYAFSFQSLTRLFIARHGYRLTNWLFAVQRNMVALIPKEDGRGLQV